MTRQFFPSVKWLDVALQFKWFWFNNDTTTEFKNGQFWQNSVAGKLGANYSMNNNMVAYVNIDSRFSNLIRGTYGASVGLKLNF